MKKEDEQKEATAQDNGEVQSTDPFRKAMEDLDPEESGYAPAFMFNEVGDMIVGTVQDIGEGFSEQYGSHPCVTVKDEEDGEEKSIHVFHSTMLSMFESKNPGLGERIALKRMADRKSPTSGHNYFRFLLKVDRTVGAVTRFNQIQSHLIPSADAQDLTEPETGEDDLPF